MSPSLSSLFTIRWLSLYVIALAAWSAGTPRAVADDVYFVMPILERGVRKAAIIREAQRLDERLTALGYRHLQLGAVREAIETKHSKQPLELSPQDLDKFLEESRKAGIEAANHRFAQALTHLERARTHVEGAVETLMRDERQRKNWDNHCLLMLDTLIQRGNQLEADRRAIECVRFDPAIDVDAMLFPHEVQRTIEQARSFLSRQKTGALAIESIPSGCPAFLNGRRIGDTRAVIQQPSPGVHSVQVEGGAAGRVYLVEMGRADVTLRIDVILDQALRTDEPVARLDYRTLDAPQVDQHLNELARAIGASAGLSLRLSPQRDLILRHSRTQREVRFPFEASEEELTSVLTSLLAPQALTEGPRRVTRPGEQAEADAQAPMGRTRLILDRRFPLALTVTGGLALAAAWSMAIASDGHDLLGSGATSTGLTGGSMMLIGNSLGWQKPRPQGSPGPAWLALPLGLASVVVGSVLWAVGDKCNGGEDCNASKTRLYGSLAVGSGLGLMSFPFGYLASRRGFTTTVATALDTRTPARALHLRFNWRL